MKVPWILRLGLIRALLTSRFTQISYGHNPLSGGAYRFELEDKPKGWEKRRLRMLQKAQRRRERDERRHGSSES